MSVNRNNISTSADGADIFNIGAADSPFINLGNLTTSGNLARAIRVSANGVTIDNKCNITTNGNGSSAIIVGEAFAGHYDNVTIMNHGSITTTGATFDDGTTLVFASGIDLFGNNNKGVNYGTITNLVGDDAGMSSVGLNCTLANFGKIDSQFLGMVIDQIDGTEIGNMVVNFGQIHTTADGSHGIWLLVGDNVAKNYGIIQVDGVFSFGMALEGDRNHGENHGTILGTGDLDRGVLLEGEDLTFDNYGTVRTTGVDSVGVRFAGENLSGTDGGTFTNLGKVVSAGWAVRGSLSDDHVINRGAMAEVVALGGGADSYVAGKGGSLSGTLTLGDGNDLIVFEKGGGKLTVTDFVAGAGSDDVIDLSAFGYHSLVDVLSHASQSGADVILKLGARDQIVLENVSVGALSADDFAFGGSAQMQFVHHDVLGLI